MTLLGRYSAASKQGLVGTCLMVGLWSCGPTPSATPLEVTPIDASCSISVEAWAPGDGTHLPEGTAITWASNPPASGPHFPRWAGYQEFDAPAPRGNWVHSLEHGAVVLLFNCASLPEGTDCEPIKQVLRDAAASLPADGLCTAPVRTRTVITPDPLIDTPIAAVSWGFIYRAPCVDLPSLSAFAAAHYAKGPENVCANGVTRF